MSWTKFLVATLFCGRCAYAACAEGFTRPALAKPKALGGEVLQMKVGQHSGRAGGIGLSNRISWFGPSRARLLRPPGRQHHGREVDAKVAGVARQLEQIRRETSRHRRRAPNVSPPGRGFFWNAKAPTILFIPAPNERAGLLKTLLSNCAFDRGSLCPT